jgi:hypothetical protein
MVRRRAGLFQQGGQGGLNHQELLDIVGGQIRQRPRRYTGSVRQSRLQPLERVSASSPVSAD